MVSAKNVNVGFHRIGAACAGVVAVPGIASVFAAGVLATGWVPSGYQRSEWGFFLGGGAALLALSAGCYVLARTVGWIIAGFIGDEQHRP